MPHSSPEKVQHEPFKIKDTQQHNHKSNSILMSERTHNCHAISYHTHTFSILPSLFIKQDPIQVQILCYLSHPTQHWLFGETSPLFVQLAHIS